MRRTTYVGARINVEDGSVKVQGVVIGPAKVLDFDLGSHTMVVFKEGHSWRSGQHTRYAPARIEVWTFEHRQVSGNDRFVDLTGVSVVAEIPAKSSAAERAEMASKIGSRM